MYPVVGTHNVVYFVFVSFRSELNHFDALSESEMDVRRV